MYLLIKVITKSKYTSLSDRNNVKNSFFVHKKPENIYAASIHELIK